MTGARGRPASFRFAAPLLRPLRTSPVAGERARVSRAGPDVSVPRGALHEADLGRDLGPGRTPCSGSREGYPAARPAPPRPPWETLSYRGLPPDGVATVNRAPEAWGEVSKRAFVGAMRKQVPAVGLADLGARHAGVRAQAVAEDGTLLDDFRLDEAPNVTHIRNAPSPASHLRGASRWPDASSRIGDSGLTTLFSEPAGGWRNWRYAPWLKTRCVLAGREGFESSPGIRRSKSAGCAEPWARGQVLRCYMT